MKRHPLRSAFLLAALAAGCSCLGSARGFDPGEFERDGDWIAVRTLPFLPQSTGEGCGPAALAMVLSYWMGPVSIEEVAAACPTIPGEGAAAGDLRDLARARGFRAYLIRGELADLERELSEGRPVVVGLVKPFLASGYTHYEVVVGLHRSGRRIVTLDPARGWRVNDFDGFRLEWDPAGRPALVLIPGSRPPEGARKSP